MRLLSGLWFLLASLWRRPLLWWVKTRVAPSGLPQELGLDPSRPVCYVLAARSIADQFLLEDICRTQSLPPPRGGFRELPKPGRAAVVALPRLEGQGMKRRYGNPVEIRRMVTQAIVDRDYDVQLVPVSVFWGRNPEQETSLLKIIFSDSLRAGPLRKLFIILVNGRNTFVSLGKPISFQAFMAHDPEPQAATRKLVRVLRVHFRRQRAVTLGPTLSNRAQVLGNVIAAPAVREAIRLEAAAERISFEQAEERAWNYADEIAADYNNAAISFVVRILTWLWNRIFDGIQVHHAERLREIAHTHGVVYLPSHRSHMDYLLVSYVLYQQGMVPPHVAAGINLNFWPVGTLIRRLGGFYLRRKFGGNKLYTAVFRAYVDFLMARGYSMQFFPEGGRSRTGRLIPPKTGLLSMTVQSFLRNPGQPIVMVPVYTGYDRILPWELNSYFKELKGSATKKKESVGGLIRATRVVRMAFGKSYVSFGEPLNLAEFLDAREPSWRADLAIRADGEWPAWFSEFITTLAHEMMTRINSAAALSPVGLVATAVLANPEHAVAEEELCEQLDSWLELLRARPYSDDVWVPPMSGGAILGYVEKIARLTRIQHPWGDVITAEGRDAVLLTYYRNSVLHLLALPSLIASYFQGHDMVEEAALVEGCMELYPFLRREVYLRWRDKETEHAIREMTDVLVGRCLLSRDGSVLRRPAVTSLEFGSLMGLANIMRETLERYAMTTVLLAENLPAGHIERSEFEQQCHLMAQRMAVLSGRNAPEYFDKALFSNYIDTMKRLQLLSPHHQYGDRALAIDPQVQRMAEQSMRRLSGGAQQRMRRLLSRPRPVPAPREEPAAQRASK